MAVFQTYTINCVAAIATLATSAIAASDFYGCSGTVVIGASDITLGTGDAVVQIDGGLISSMLLGAGTFEVELDGTNAQNANAEMLISVLDTTACSASAGLDTYMVVLGKMNGTNWLVQANINSEGVQTNAAVTGSNVRSKWKFVLTGITGARTLTIQRANWNGVGFDSFTTILTHDEVGRGETWPDAAFENLNVVLQLRNTTTSDQGVFREFNP